jgi:hypothetical protein
MNETRLYDEVRRTIDTRMVLTSRHSRVGSCPWRRLGAGILLACHLLVLLGTPAAIAAEMAFGTDATTVCNCIHEPGTTCPMHGGGDGARPHEKSDSPQWCACGSGGDAALLRVATALGVLAPAPVVSPAVRLVGRASPLTEPLLDTPHGPLAPPPRI